MNSPDLSTILLTRLSESIRNGDAASREELFRRILGRVEKIARRMLNQFPSLRKHEETMDIVQATLVRLMRSLNEIQFASTRDFFGLVAQQVRRELLELSRYYSAQPERGFGS